MQFITGGNSDVLWITVLKIQQKALGSWVLNTVIHRQNDEWQTVAWWRKYAVSAIIDEEIKGASVMAIKYTEEQLNSVDKSLLVQMFLNQQEQLESLTAEIHSLNEKMQLMMEQLILSKKERFGRSSEKMEDFSQISFMEVETLYSSMRRKLSVIWMLRNPMILKLIQIKSRPRPREKRKRTCPVLMSMSFLTT